MGKQINFYATESDKAIIADVLTTFFGDLIEMPYCKGPFSVFKTSENQRMLYLAEASRQSDICYRTHEYYDRTTAEILDYRKSPVLEYSLPFINTENAYVAGRFYCCSDDMEFSQKVSKFYTKLKKEFWYVKKWKKYISKNIDVERLFFIPNETIQLTTADFK